MALLLVIVLLVAVAGVLAWQGYHAQPRLQPIERAQLVVDEIEQIADLARTAMFDVVIDAKLASLRPPKEPVRQPTPDEIIAFVAEFEGW